MSKNRLRSTKIYPVFKIYYTIIDLHQEDTAATIRILVMIHMIGTVHPVTHIMTGTGHLRIATRLLHILEITTVMDPLRLGAYFI